MGNRRSAGPCFLSIVSGIETLRSARWVITGGCGFIGRNLVAALKELGFDGIRILDDLSVGTRDHLRKVTPFEDRSRDSLLNGARFPDGGTVELVEGSILDRELVNAAMWGADLVVHLAANTGVAPSVENPVADCQANVLGTLHCLEAARAAAVDRFVFASSGAPVGECEPPIHEEIPPHPVSPYGASKLAGEGYCSAYSKTFDLDTVALRFGNVYGPRSDQKSSVVAKFIRRAFAGEVLEVYGTGEQTRDFIFIDDLLRAVLAAVARPEARGEVFQIATAEETTVNELVDVLLPLLRDAGVDGIEVRSAPVRPGDVKRNFSDTSKAERLLNWQARVPLDEGLGRTVEWFNEELGAETPSGKKSQ